MVEFLKLKNIQNADIVLMDVKMNDKQNYENAFEISLRYIGNIRIVAVTNEINYLSLLLIIKNGFKGCVFRNNIDEDIISNVR